MRRAARVDDNQERIVTVYRRAGCSVAITSALGNGFPDIVVGKHGINELVEIKDGNKPPSEQKLTEKEARFHSLWKGSVRVIKNENEALQHIHEMRQKNARMAEIRLGEALRNEWPDESRIDIIGSNGNDGEHYGSI